MMALLGAGLLWAAFPPLDLWPLAWVAPIPWVWLIRCKRLGGCRPYMVLALAGFAFWMAALHWLRLPDPATSVGWVAISFYFAFYLPLFVGLGRVAVHRLRVPVILAAPVVWTGLELARGRLMSGMTMASLGHTQYHWIGLIQISDLGGAYGVSFVVMLVAASLARMLPGAGLLGAMPTLVVGMWRSSGNVNMPTASVGMAPVPKAQRFPWWFLAITWPLLPAAAVLAAALCYGHLRMAGNATDAGPRIALVQGSIDIEMRYNPGMRERIFQQYYDLSRKAVAKYPGLDLVVWPETMFLESLVTFDADARRPADFQGTDAEFREWLPRIAARNASLMGETARRLGVPLLLGVDRNHFGADGPKCYNSAAYVGRDGRLLGRYDKMHLVPFGEYVPLADRWPWLQRLTPLPISVTAGEEPAALELRRGGNSKAVWRIAPNICYETVLPQVIRRQVNTLAAEGREPDVLVNLTNDGWFWGSSELDMHLACGVFRAVECRRPLLVAANTGFSAWIDGDGNIVQQGPRRDTGVILAEPRLDRRRSWYLAHGDWLAGVCLAACGLFAAVGLYGRTRPVLCR